MAKKQPWNVRKRSSRFTRSRVLRKKFFILTEGATEAAHFSNYRQLPNPTVAVIDKSDSKRSLVEKAVTELEMLKTQGEFLREVDEAWVVMDRDATPSNPQDKSNFNEALQLASNNKIMVAYSNDCFELWLLLHFQDVSSAMTRDVVCEKLSKHLGSRFKKGAKGDIFEIIKPMRGDAIKRAHSLNKTHKSASAESANPSTKIHLLVEKLISQPGFRE